MCGTTQLVKTRANHIKFVSLLQSRELVVRNSTCVEKRTLGYRPSAAAALAGAGKAFIHHVVWSAFLPNPQETTPNEIPNSLLLNQNFNIAAAGLLRSTAARAAVHTTSVTHPQDSPLMHMRYTGSLRILFKWLGCGVDLSSQSTFYC